MSKLLEKAVEEVRKLPSDEQDEIARAMLHLAAKDNEPVNGAYFPDELEQLRSSGKGPWSPEALAEDARAAEAFERTGEGIPFEEVTAWMKSWGSPNELPVPKSRKL